MKGHRTTFKDNHVALSTLVVVNSFWDRNNGDYVKFLSRDFLLKFSHKVPLTQFLIDIIYVNKTLLLTFSLRWYYKYKFNFVVSYADWLKSYLHLDVTSIKLNDFLLTYRSN